MAKPTRQHAPLLGPLFQSSPCFCTEKKSNSPRPSHQQRRQNGLSLVEVLVSLSVLALIGIVASSSLQQALRLSENIEVRSEKLQQLQSIQSLFRSDIESSTRIYYPQQNPQNKLFSYPRWYETKKTSHNIVLAGRQARPFIGERGDNHIVIEDFFYSFEQKQLTRHYKRHELEPWVKSIIPMEFQSFAVNRPSRSASSGSGANTQQSAVSSNQESKMLIIKWSNNAYGEMSLWSLEP